MGTPREQIQSQAQRLLRLQLRCQLEREHLARQTKELRPLFTGLDRCGEVISLANQLSTPIKYGVLAGLTGLLLVHPQKSISLLTTGLRYWSWWQKIFPFIIGRRR